MRKSITVVTVSLLAACSLPVRGGTATSSPTTSQPAPTSSSAVTPTSVAASTTMPPTTAPEPTESTAPGAATTPTELVAVGGDPFLVDIPGKMIDVVPSVAYRLGIDVPGQYYEILPKFYVFIPTEASRNPNLRVPTEEDRDKIEAYVSAVAAIWTEYLKRPIPPTGSDAMRETLSPQAFNGYESILREANSLQGHTEIFEGNILAPFVVDGSRPTDSRVELFDCIWLDQQDFTEDGEPIEKWNYREQFESSHIQVIYLDDGWKVNELYAGGGNCDTTPESEPEPSTPGSDPGGRSA